MSKGKATTTFDVEAGIFGEEFIITATADVSGMDTATMFDNQGEANGIVALGKLVAEFGKVVTPLSRREVKVNALAAVFMSQNDKLTNEEAIEMAQAFV